MPKSGNRSPENFQVFERTGFRPLPRTRSGVRRNDGNSSFQILYDNILFDALPCQTPRRVLDRRQDQAVARSELVPAHGVDTDQPRIDAALAMVRDGTRALVDAVRAEVGRVHPMRAVFASSGVGCEPAYFGRGRSGMIWAAMYPAASQ
jgi:hypothetical protein